MGPVRSTRLYGPPRRPCTEYTNDLLKSLIQTLPNVRIVNYTDMAQEQPRRPAVQEPMKYGDVFPAVSGSDLANEPVAPRDAAAMQAAENKALGKIQKGGPAAVMQSAATKNVQSGVLSGSAVSDVAKNEGVKLSMKEVDGRRVITEAIGDQVLGQFVEPEVGMTDPTPVRLSRDSVTIGEALESAAKSAAGDKPVTQSDAAAITAAEMRAARTNKTPSGGVGAEAQSAANWNARTADPNSRKTIREVLGDAKEKLVEDKEANKFDAEAVVSAEIRNTPYMTTTPGGVAESIATAARVNQEKKNYTSA